MDRELEESFQRGMRRSPQNLGAVSSNITNSCMRIEPMLSRMKYEIHYSTYFIDHILYHHFSACPYATNVLFICDMHYYWRGSSLYFHIASSNGLIENDFRFLTKSIDDAPRYTWRIDDICGPEILAEVYVYQTMLIAYNYYFINMYVKSCKARGC